jgi:uncharacterized damage-inducible protein DinB
MIENQYPIGKFKYDGAPDDDERKRLIDNIANLPTELIATVENLNDEQLDTPYREGGWTVRQLIHHIADSHLNSFIRFKWTINEDKPKIKAYDQEMWSENIDAKSGPPHLSLALLQSLHERWVFFMRTLSAEEFEKEFDHPESGMMSLNMALVLYDWHGRHHLTQIINIKKKMDW